MTVLIPAYEPDLRLIELIDHIKENSDFRIVVVDDGSGPSYREIFDKAESLGCTVLRHDVNRGKGRALKTGFAHILARAEETEGVVTADADGQHLVLDIMRVAEQIPLSPGKIVIGARKFVGRVPVRSMIGNCFIRLLFTVASGNYILDTQTGLRGFPVRLLPLMLKIPGERFEYEMEMLLEGNSAGYGFRQLTIETVYLEGNKSSHFNPVVDSIRVCLPFLKFCLSSITAAVVDYVLLFVFQWLIGSVLRLPASLFFGVVLARAASSMVNFTINRTMVFTSKAVHQPTKAKALHYYTLVVALMLVNYMMLKFFTDYLGIWLFWSKLLTECLLFLISYTVQRFFVFRHRPVAD